MTRLRMRHMLGLALVSPPVLIAQVTTAQYDNARTGAYLAETTLTPRNVNAATFGRTHVIEVDGDVYAQVLYLPSVDIRGKGTHSVIFVATEHNSVYAFDAVSPSAPLWHVDLSSVVPGAKPVPARDVHCPFMRPEVGITATPVIDTTSGTIYVLARTKEHGDYVQRLHALDVTSGAARRPPVVIRAASRGAGAGSGGGIVSFDPLRENPRAALLLSHGRVVIAWASSCDVGPFHGWIMAFDARSLAKRAVLNLTPDGTGGGIWQGDAGLAADQDGVIYAVTGNGTFDAGDGSAGRDYGDTVLRLTLTARGFTVSDFFTPDDQKILEERDGDLGAGGPLLLPDQPGAHPHLVLVGGKGRGVYLLDRDRMGKFDPTGNQAAVQTMEAPGMVMGASAYWNGHVFTLWSRGVIQDFALSNGRLSANPVARGAHIFTDPGATPTISANGARDGIVWVLETKTWNGDDRPAVLHAYDAANVAVELYSSESNARRDRAGTALRFTIPTVAGGRVYVGAKGEVDVYGLRMLPGKGLPHRTPTRPASRPTPTPRLGDARHEPNLAR